MDSKYDKHIKVVLAVFYIVLGAACVYVLFKYLLGWFAPFILAYLFATLIDPLVCFFVKKFRFKRPFATIFSILLAFTALSALLTLLVNRSIYELGSLSQSLPLYLDRLEEVIVNLINQCASFLCAFGINITPDLSLAELVMEAGQHLQSLIPTLSSGAWSLATRITSALPQFFIFLVAFLVSTYFFSSDKEKIGAFILAQFSPKQQQMIRDLRAHLFSTLFCYLRALLILLFITFVELLIGLSIIGVDYVVIVSFVIALVDALPILGTGTILIPWALVSLLMGDYLFGISLIIVYVIILLVRQVLEPKVIGQSIGLYPLLTLMAIYIGYRTIGLLGMFLGPILVIMLKFIQDSGYFHLFTVPDVCKSPPKEKKRRFTLRKKT